MTNKIYLFSYETSGKKERTEACISERLSKLYDVKQVHKGVYLIKTIDEVSLFEKYLRECFDRKDTYFIVEITEQKKRFINTSSTDINSWMENI
ncbi:hypothetical protein [Halobacillus campisalis]|uniref:Uncharacterized protein n=1 Tax=Halobacillus campisalis TaxID=435909 RepID=A0ABW2K1P9_9BACI|nr:hypothetical protein [Halobacillus campisalis]